VLNQKTYLLCFLVSLFVASVLVPWVERWARRRGIVERPNSRKPSTGVLKPVAGGLAVFVATWLPIALLQLHENLVVQRLRLERDALLALLLAGFGAALLGLYDDARGANARQKLAVQTGIATALFFAGVRIDVLKLPLVGDVALAGPVAFAATVFWIVAITNALNLVDGIDGLAAGVALFAALTTGLVNGIAGDALLAVTMLSLAGALVGFLRFNFHPARIFLGDTGSLFLGMTLAVAAVVTNTKRTVAVSMFVPLATLAYPILDTTVAVVRRHFRGRPFWSADRQHIHHKLLARGLTAGRVAITIYGFSILFGALAVGLTLDSAPAVTIASVAAATVIIVAGRNLGLVELVRRIPIEERRRLTRLRHLVDYGIVKLADEPALLQRLLQDVASEAGARVALREVASTPSDGTVIATDGSRALVADLATGSQVYREEALAQLARFAWESRALETLAPAAPVVPPVASSVVEVEDGERSFTNA
jgi:UDP-GlcNAc:undecaprenyl-phosphate GlcNAc-1-phosphate transferase